MSSCCISVCLLVLLGAAFATAKPLNFISNNLRSTHESIADELGLKQPEIGGEHLFSPIIRGLNTSCQKHTYDVQLMKTTLEVYMQIFSQTSNLLDHVEESKRPNLRTDLIILQEKMKKLQEHLNHLNHDRENAFSRLNEIKETRDDPLVQKRALAEFLEVYQAASVTLHRAGADSAA